MPKRNSGKTAYPVTEVADAWFEQKGWKPFPFQKKVWENFLADKSGLLNAPTGSGKTYALWVPCLLDYIRKNPETYKTPKKNGLQVLWITPLRALAKDIRLAMQHLCFDLEIPWEVGLRTGDTSSAERQRQRKNAPECLITTPESMHLMLAQKDARHFFKGLRAVIVDEWHELLGTKRGVQVELALSRIRHFNKHPIKVWGVSATIGNLDQALDVLLGIKDSADHVIVRAKVDKKLRIDSILPDEVEKFPWAGHLGIKLWDKVMPILNKSQTTLLFTNTRSQTEIWYQRLLDKHPELAGAMAMHHGSLDNSVRGWVEEALHKGRLQLVVCTSSLDLGVDFRPVETVIQVGSPKGVARFMQRAGRSGHQPGAVSHIYFLPTHSLELIEAAALKEAVLTGQFESRKPLEKSIDVLVQYLVTLAVGEGYYPQDILEEVKTTFSFQNLTDAEWEWALTFVTTGGKSLGQYDEFQKIEVSEEGYYKVTSRKTAMRHRLSIGTIVSDPVMKVKFVGGGFIGTVEEGFASKLNRGDVFWFAGRSLEFVRIKELTVQVKKAKKVKGTVPRWAGGRMPLSSQMSRMIRKKLEDARNNRYDSIELRTIMPLLQLQSKWSVIPTMKELLVENFKSREGYHLFFYPFEGRAVHEVLAALVAYRISVSMPVTFSLAMNDYGFELLTDIEIRAEDVLELDVFSEDNLLEDVKSSINEAEMARRRFREIAAIAGLIFQGYPGKPITNKHLQASSGVLYDVFQEYDPDNLLIKQAEEEVLSLQIEQSRLTEAIHRINQQQLIIKNPPKPTPFAFPIMVDRLREKLTSEKLEDRILKLQLQLEKYAETGE
ncbi:ligase-associated DNA damage response DEXH box helicase [Roseivirga sp. BDSF3-8]|uniref:ligase-associated DNA damage response DEXH box helicase n=1 Tax=Roseivirga sp. BDSF3-8 TaxID=3241598 RepID=UPI003531DD8D